MEQLNRLSASDAGIKDHTAYSLRLEKVQKGTDILHAVKIPIVGIQYTSKSVFSLFYSTRLCRVSGYPGIRVSGYPGIRVSGYPTETVIPGFHFLGFNLIPVSDLKISTEHLSHTNGSLRFLGMVRVVFNIEAGNYYSKSTFIITQENVAFIFYTFGSIYVFLPKKYGYPGIQRFPISCFQFPK